MLPDLDKTTYIHTRIHTLSPSQVINKRCYQTFTQPATLEEARSNCRIYGGHLADIPSHHVETEIKRQYSGVCKEIWISLNDQEKEGTWEWSRRELNSDDYVNWAPSEPDNGARGE